MRVEPHLWGVALSGGEGVRLKALARRILGDERPKQYVPVLREPHPVAPDAEEPMSVNFRKNAKERRCRRGEIRDVIGTAGNPRSPGSRPRSTGKTDGTETGSSQTFERSLMAQRLRPRDALRKAANPASPYRRSASEEREGC